MPASADQCRDRPCASAARVSCEVASDSESRTPAAGIRLVAAPASATTVPSAVTVIAAPMGAKPVYRPSSTCAEVRTWRPSSVAKRCTSCAVLASERLPVVPSCAAEEAASCPTARTEVASTVALAMP